MILLFCFLIRHFIISPWFIPNDSASKLLCHGYLCGASKESITSSDQLKDIFKGYKKGDLKRGLSIAMESLLAKKFLPAMVASGVFHLFGIGDFEYNREKSFKILHECANRTSWIAHEILSFHPLTKDNMRIIHLKAAAKMGSAIAMQIIANQHFADGKYNKSLNLMYTLLTSMSPMYYQKRRSGPTYARSVRSILLNDRNVALSWRDLFSKAKGGHLPSALWIIDGFINGKFHNATSKELSVMAMKYIEDAPWNIDAFSILNSDDTINKKEIIHYLAQTGNEVAQAYDSYAEFF